MGLARIRRRPDAFVAPVPSAAPQRGHSVIVKNPSAPDTNLTWRAVVHAASADSVQTTWHLAKCRGSADPEAHCPEGQRMMHSLGEPDGHCLVNGDCPRCDALSAR
jgi:hypothetical protein